MLGEIRLGKIFPVKKTTKDGRPVFSGFYECYDQDTYMKLVARWEKMVTLSEGGASVVPEERFLLQEINEGTHALVAAVERMSAKLDGEALPTKQEVDDAIPE